MKIWIDGVAFENDAQLGVWRVFFEVMTRTSKDIEYTLWLRAKPRRPIPENVRIYRDNGREEIARFDVLRRLQRRIGLTRDPSQLDLAHIFHSTGFTNPVQKSMPSVLTVYDMIAESHFPMCIRELREGIATKYAALERAASLPCISKSTANELAAFYPALASKAAVVPLGADHLLDDRPRSVGKSSISGHALFVGQRMGYKNFFNLLHAMTTPFWPRAVNLLVVGAKWLDGEQQLIAKLGLSGRVQHLGTVSDDNLKSIYRSARCLVFPSFQEGFGLPCLEAQANNCPLVCSDIPVFREVAGDAALYFDPRLAESIAAQVSVLDDDRLRRELIERGDANVRFFTWQDTALRMLEAYRRVKH